MTLALTAPLPPLPVPFARTAADLLHALAASGEMVALSAWPWLVPPQVARGAGLQALCELPDLLARGAVRMPIHYVEDTPLCAPQLRFVAECPGLLVLPSLRLDALRAACSVSLRGVERRWLLVQHKRGDLAVQLAEVSRAVVVATAEDAQVLRHALPQLAIHVVPGIARASGDPVAAAAQLRAIAQQWSCVPASAPIQAPAAGKVTAIVVTFNGKAVVGPALQSLLAQDYPALDILVVDNQSTDGTAAYVRAQFPSVRVIESGMNRGFGAGNNLGIAATDAEFIVLLNQDAIARRDWVTELVRVAALDGAIASVGSTMLCMRCPSVRNSTGIAINELGFAWDRDIGERDLPREPFADAVRPTPVFGACGGAVLYRRDALLRIGGFDEAFFLYYEDTDVAWRLLLAGYQNLYAPLAVVRHDVHGDGLPDPGREARRRFLAERNRLALLVKNTSLADLPRLLWRLRKQDRRRLRWLDAAVQSGADAQRFAERASLIRRAWRDLLLHMPSLLRRRFHAQRLRRVHDARIAELRVKGSYEGGFQGDVEAVHDRHSAKQVAAIAIGQDDFGTLGPGWHAVERDQGSNASFRWTRAEAWCYLAPPSGARHWRIVASSPRGEHTVRVAADGVPIGEFVLGTERREYALPLPPGVARDEIVEFALTVTSAHSGQSASPDDPRELGIAVFGLQVS